MPLRPCIKNLPMSGVLIPPVLVQLLRALLKRYATGIGGRIFRTTRGVLQDSAYSAVWAAPATPPPSFPVQHASPLAGSSYDLRHPAVPLVAELRR
jgi:hypothetical protein